VVTTTAEGLVVTITDCAHWDAAAREIAACALLIARADIAATMAAGIHAEPARRASNATALTVANVSQTALESLAGPMDVEAVAGPVPPIFYAKKGSAMNANPIVPM